jgi:hypothetical protein
VVLGEWRPVAAGSLFNLTVMYVWRAPPSPWSPPTWALSPEDYFLFAVFGAFLLVLAGAAVRWCINRASSSSSAYIAVV